MASPDPVQRFAAPWTPPPAHYLRSNDSASVPQRFLYLDTEARRRPRGRGEVQTFALAVAAYVGYDRRGRAPKAPETAMFKCPTELWSWVAERCENRQRTVLVAHNLAYDLRISDALGRLPALGFELTRIRLDRGSSYARFERHRAALVMVDLYSWLPVPLHELATELGLDKPALPTDDEDEAALERRCSADVAIVREGWERIINFVEKSNLGTWQPTGAGMGFVALRHGYLDRRIVVGRPVIETDTERRAAWTGRCEAWRWGKVREPWVAEWDYELSYGRIAYDAHVPIVPAAPPHAGDLDELRFRLTRAAVLAEVTVTTTEPIVPAMVGERIAWPVGTFTTTLWDPELRLADQAGAI
ncbi:MAG: hypothetical protein ACRD2T_04080, partial [Thermoanaerobaculia bacterium]